jgi:hypothetical protein
LLHDPSGIDDGDLVRQHAGLGEVVRHDDGGHPRGAQHGGQLARGVSARARVERGQWLVEQQRAGVGGERPCKGDALALATGQLARPRLRDMVGAEPLQRGKRALAAARTLQPVGDVAPRAQVRKERVVLEDDPAPPVLGRDAATARRVQPGSLAAADQARARAQQPGDHAQHRRLARAGRTRHGQAGSLRDVERHVEVEVPQRMAELSVQQAAPSP